MSNKTNKKCNTHTLFSLNKTKSPPNNSLEREGVHAVSQRSDHQHVTDAKECVNVFLRQAAGLLLLLLGAAFGVS